MSRLNLKMLAIIQLNFFLPVLYPKTRRLEYVNYTTYYFTGVWNLVYHPRTR